MRPPAASIAVVSRDGRQPAPIHRRPLLARPSAVPATLSPLYPTAGVPSQDQLAQSRGRRERRTARRPTRRRCDPPAAAAPFSASSPPFPGGGWRGGPPNSLIPGRLGPPCGSALFFRFSFPNHGRGLVRGARGGRLQPEEPGRAARLYGPVGCPRRGDYAEAVRNTGQKGQKGVSAACALGAGSGAHFWARVIYPRP